MDEFLAVGLLALAYGFALLIHSYGFLAAFAAGVALRRVEASHSADNPPDIDVSAAAIAGKKEEVSTDAETAPAYMTQAVLGFNEQLERICEVGVVILIGSMLATHRVPAETVWLLPALFLLIRPVAVLVGAAFYSMTRAQRRLMCWFGIRGVGSIYYLMFALQHGVSGEIAERLVNLTLIVIAGSIALHGISVTPLMNLYASLTKQGK